MPAALVDKSLIRTVDAGKPAHADVRAEYGAMTEEEIDAALNDDELDLELEQLRLSRLQQLRQGAPAAKRAGQDDQNKSAGVKRGVLTALPAELFLDLAFSGQPVVALMTPGDQTFEARKSGAPSDDLSAGIAAHMAALSHEFVGSLFVTVAVHGKEGDSLRHSLSLSDLPAFICIRQSVIVSMVIGVRLRQFVQMGPVGGAIFRAWLQEARMLYSTAADAAAAHAGSQDEPASSRRGRGRRRTDSDDDIRSSDDSESDGSDEGEEEEEDQVDEDGETDDSSFVGRRNNVAGGGRLRRRGEGVGEEGSASALDGALNGAFMSAFPPTSGRTVSRAQTSDQKSSNGQVRGCSDPKCRNRSFFHQHIIGGVNRKRRVNSNRAVDDLVGHADPGNTPFALHPHDTH
eukprot:GHVU01152332.1.p1 GENE.GHVU01152332.1~~GHVU01152332.1.p1  ORF type:complete len:441 (+),score=63.81 GHVU01152332.1:117-1325(+)